MEHDFSDILVQVDEERYHVEPELDEPLASVVVHLSSVHHVCWVVQTRSTNSGPFHVPGSS